MYANTHDVDFYVSQIIDSTRSLEDQATPNLARAALNLARLRDWSNAVSDGWAYWPKPQASAQRLIKILEDARLDYMRGAEVEDITAADLRKALAPVKAMITRAGKAGVDTRHGGGPILLEA